MKSAVEEGGGRAVVDLILALEDDLERRALFVFARTGLVMREWEGKNFDDAITVCDAGLKEVLRQAKETAEEETYEKRVQAAHTISYNLAADLADCWPGDEAPRAPRHFERGLKAAEDCLMWCSPEVVSGLSMDWWARGMHQLSLGRSKSAAASFGKSLDYAVLLAEHEERPTEVSPAGDFGVILATGYLGVARTASGDETGNALYVQAVTSFGAQTQDEEKKGDARFGIAQLEKVREKYG